jgi:predicted DCC family thiol-disulfide oxidoreductase YuxK
MVSSAVSTMRKARRATKRNASPCYALQTVPDVAPDTEYVFYDGHCGLCHRTVQFVLRRDLGGKFFRFAPLEGPTFAQRVPSSRRSNLPDSIVVLTSDGQLLARSNAILHVLRRLGGVWSTLAAAVAIIPRPVRDTAYNFIARVRYSIFGRRDETCPLVPPGLRSRFDP